MGFAPGRGRVLDSYYSELRRCRILSIEEEQLRFREYRTCSRCQFRFPPSSTMVPRCPECDQERNHTARDILLKSALRFVVGCAVDYAKRTRGISFPPEHLATLVSAGNLGLLVAVDRFDPDRGNRFLTYAAFWVREKILQELDHLGIVHVPPYRQKALRARRRLGLDVEGDEALVLIDELSAANEAHADDEVEGDVLNQRGFQHLYAAFAALHLRTRDRYILLGSVGFKEEARNDRQLARRLGLSTARVREIRRDGLERIRRHLARFDITQSDQLLSEE